MRSWFRRSSQTATVAIPLPSEEEESAAPAKEQEEPKPAAEKAPPAVAVSASAGQAVASSAAEQPVAAKASAEESRLRTVTKPAAPSYRADHKSLYKEFLRGLYDAVLVTDPKGHVIDSNPRVTELFLYSPADLWDTPVEELVRGVSMQVLERIRQNVVQNRHVLLDANCRRRDGSFFPAEVAISKLNLINEGDYVFCVRNVERRRQALQRLRSQHNAVMNASNAFAVMDLQGNMVFVNPAMCETWSATRASELTNRNIRTIWQAPAGIEKALGLAISGDRWIGPLPAQGLQGRRFMVEAMLAPDRDARNEIVGIVSSFIEVAGVE
ncbi:MAG: PAS domain S-box protein [Kiritimatiellae bacterium]|nr:PAS domain S-box protein [Kiritimatiellia bacterium]